MMAALLKKSIFWTLAVLLSTLPCCKGKGMLDLDTLDTMFDDINYCSTGDDCASYVLMNEDANGSSCLCDVYYYNESEPLSEIEAYIESHTLDPDCCISANPPLCGTDLRCDGSGKCYRYLCPQDDGGTCIPDCP